MGEASIEGKEAKDKAGRLPWTRSCVDEDEGIVNVVADNIRFDILKPRRLPTFCETDNRDGAMERRQGQCADTLPGKG